MKHFKWILNPKIIKIGIIPFLLTVGVTLLIIIITALLVKKELKKGKDK